jgi:hypothetical protein
VGAGPQQAKRAIGRADSPGPPLSRHPRSAGIPRGDRVAGRPVATTAAPPRLTTRGPSRS